LFSFLNKEESLLHGEGTSTSTSMGLFFFYGTLSLVPAASSKRHLSLPYFDCELAELQQEGGTYDDVLVLIMKYVDVV
jgi:hypothetical protein